MLVSCGRSWACSGPVQLCIRQKLPVSLKFAPFTTGPITPLSPATPESALSNLLTSSIWRMPAS